MTVTQCMLVFGVVATTTAQDDGPGRGPWETATPESMGLSQTALEKAEADTARAAGSRYCYLVVKKGKIVYEKYYGSRDKSTTNTAWSTTKSLCSTMFGIAKEQGWADESMMPENTVKNTLRCSKGAKWANVLTMTGTSPNMNSPRFSYDLLGIECYNTISNFIGENNPEKLSTSAWKDKYLWNKLGLEHSTWPKETPDCGLGSEMSCRDLARHAQLWLNRGVWEGEQLVSKEFILRGSTQVFPKAGGDPYGYGVRLFPTDPFAKDTAYFGGVNIQCAFFTEVHDAIVVTMGNALLQNCKSNVWDHSRNAIISHGEQRGWQNFSASVIQA